MAAISMLVHNAVSIEVTGEGAPGNPATAYVTIKNGEGDELFELTVFGVEFDGLPVHVDGMPVVTYFPKRASQAEEDI